MSTTSLRLRYVCHSCLRSRRQGPLPAEAGRRSILRPSPITHTRAQHSSAKQTDKPNTEKEPWQVQKKALKEKFSEEGWRPKKRLSPDALEGIRHLHAQDPERYSTPYLANQFEVSPEVIRRVLKSKWQPNEKEQADRRERWERRGQSVWDRWAELGMKPPKKWREAKVKKDDDDDDGSVVLKTQKGSDGRRASKAPSTRDIPLSSRIL